MSRPIAAGSSGLEAARDVSERPVIVRSRRRARPEKLAGRMRRLTRSRVGSTARLRANIGQQWRHQPATPPKSACCDGHPRGGLAASGWLQISEVALRQAEAPHQHHHAGGEAEETGGGPGAVRVDVAEQAREHARGRGRRACRRSRDAGARAAALAARRTRRRGTGRRAAPAPACRAGSAAPSTVSSCSPRTAGGSSANTPARPSICIRRSERRAPGGPSRLRAGAAGGAAEAGIGGRPGKQARAQSRARGEQQEAQHFPEPPLSPSSREAGSSGAGSSPRYAIQGTRLRR